MNKKHYLVTGGLGFIGTNLVKRLQKNYKITIIDNSCSHNIKYLSFNKNVRIACSTRFDNGYEKNFIDRCYPTAYTRGVERSMENDFPSKEEIIKIFS